MTNLQEVPTDELLSFQDYPTSGDTTIPISDVPITPGKVEHNLESNPHLQEVGDSLERDPSATKPFWSITYYQKYFDVDTRDVVERILASITPKWESSLKHHLRTKPDLYGPFWISVTLIFTIAISGNVADYLQHAHAKQHWKYDFHLVSYAATVIFLYVTLVPSILWGLLKWSTQVINVEGLDEEVIPGVLELICIYGYSLFIYIPVSVFLPIQINALQWSLVLLATFISGSVLLLTVMPALRLSRHKLFLSIGILSFHMLLAAGFLLYFFHTSTATVHVDTTHPPTSHISLNHTTVIPPKAASAK